MSLLGKLREYGLSEKEGQVYIALLKLGSATTTQIAKESEISRTTIYDIVKSLRDKGIVSSSIQNNVMHIEAVSPQKLIHILEERKNAIKEILSELESLEVGRPTIPRSEVFIGKEGVKTVYQQLIDAKNPLYAFSNTDAMLNLLPYYAPRHIADRVKNKIPLKVLSEDSKIAREILFSKDKKELRETRVFNELSTAKATIYVTKGMVVVMSTSKNQPMGIIIHHEEFAKMQQMIFEKVWADSAKLAK